MMREWATVASWQQGIATLNCEQRSGCGSCGAKNTCGTAVLNKINPQSQHQLQVEIAQPLEPGQRVEIGITAAFCGASLPHAAAWTHRRRWCGAVIDAF